MLKRKLVVPFGNDLESAIAEVVLPEAIERMRGKLNAVRSVTVDSSDVARNMGELIEIDRPVEFGDAEEFGSDKTGVNSDIKTTQEFVTLDKYFYKQFTMDEQEILGSRSGFILPNSLAAAIDSVSRSVEKHILSAYKQIPHFSGVIGSADPDDYDHRSLIEADSSLHNNGLVEDDKVALISQNFRSGVLRTMRLDFQGDDTRATGNLGAHYGFDINQATYAPYHTAGTASQNNGLVVVAVKGTKAITIKGLQAGETLVQGDIVELASESQTFAVAADLVADGGDLVVPVYNEVAEDVSEEAAEVKGSHEINIGLHPSSITAVFRPLEARSTEEGFAVNMVDPVSGVPLTIRSWTENGGRTKLWAVECLMGMKYHQLGRAVRIGTAGDNF